ncbi:MAG: MaoC/PaaZ C-terminal domain-containing protein [Pseudomonadota bacterium]
MTDKALATAGPGTVSADEVGRFTIATTTLLDTRRIMAYAAAVNDTNPVYFDDLREGGLSVHPGICFSLQWAARFTPDRKPDLRAAPFGVHAETDLRIYRPFRWGEAITTQGQLVARRQIPPGVYSVDRYRFTSSDGELVAELDYNGIVRGATLTGEAKSIAPSSPLPDQPVGENPVWTEQRHIPLHAGQQYTECADIYNPIHTEPSAARQGGLPDVILHGSATKAIALTAVINRCFGGDPQRVRRLAGQLRGMVLMDSTISIECLGIHEERDEKQVFFRVLNAAGAAAIAGGVVCGSPG